MDNTYSEWNVMERPRALAYGMVQKIYKKHLRASLTNKKPMTHNFISFDTFVVNWQLDILQGFRAKLCLQK